MISFRLLDDFSDAEVAVVAAIIRSGAAPAVGRDPEAEKIAVRLNLDMADAITRELDRRKITPRAVGDDLLTRLRMRLLERYAKEQEGRDAREE